MTIKIWLGDLAKYNEGSLVGEWLELPMDADDLQTKVNQYSDNGKQDYFIADHECDYDLVSEHSDPHKLNDLAERLDTLRESDAPRIAFLIEQGNDIDYALEYYEDVDFYPDMTLKDLAEHFVEEGLFGEIPESIINHIDYESIAYELSMDYTQTKAGCFRYD